MHNMARAQNKARDMVIKARQWRERIMTTNDKTGIYHERLSAATAPLIGSIISQERQVAQGQYVVSDTRCPALHGCKLE